MGAVRLPKILVLTIGDSLCVGAGERRLHLDAGLDQRPAPAPEQSLLLLVFFARLVPVLVLHSYFKTLQEVNPGSSYRSAARSDSEPP